MENTPITTLSHKEVIVQPTSRENSDVADLINDADEEINWVTARDRQTYKHKKIMTTESSAAAAAEMKPKPPSVFYMVLEAIMHNITKIKNINHNITNTHLAMYQTRIYEFLAILYTSYYRSGTEPLFISKTHRSLQWLQHKDYESTHVICCLFGGKRLLDMTYTRLKQFVRELATSLEWQAGQYGGICAIFNPVNNQWEIFWIKYHPPQQGYIILPYEFPALNEVEIFLTIVHCLQRSVINFSVIGNNSFDFNILQILNITHYTLWRGLRGSVGEDTLDDVHVCDPTPSVVQQALEYRDDDSITTTAVQASDDGGDQQQHFYAGGSRPNVPLVYRHTTQTTSDVPPTNEVTVVKYRSSKILFRLIGRGRRLSNVDKNCLYDHWKSQVFSFIVYEIVYFANGFKLHGFDIEHCVPVSFPSLVFYLLEIDGKWHTGMVEVVKAVYNEIYSPRNLKVLDVITNKQLGKKFGAIMNKIPQEVVIECLEDSQKYRDEILQSVQQYLRAIRPNRPNFLMYWQNSFKNLEFPSPICDEFVKVARELLLLE